MVARLYLQNISANLNRYNKMFNPLVDNLSNLSDAQIDEKIFELSRKYHMARNPELQSQIAVILDMFKDESQIRSSRQFQKLQGDDENGLDNLINVS